MSTRGRLTSTTICSFDTSDPSLPALSTAFARTQNWNGGPATTQTKVPDRSRSPVPGTGSHGPSFDSEYWSTTGFSPRLASFACQAIATLRISAPLPRRTSIETAGGAVSTSIHFFGGSPGLGGSSPMPTPLLTTNVKPYSPSLSASNSARPSVWLESGCLGAFRQVKPLSVVYHNSKTEIRDTPTSFSLYGMAICRRLE